MCVLSFNLLRTRRHKACAYNYPTTNFVGGQQGVGFATPRPPPTKVGGFADIEWSIYIWILAG